MEALSISVVPDGMSEGELIRRLQGGESGLFEDLYTRHSGRVYGLCLRMCGDAARAADLTQETFLRVWEKLESFRGESKFTSWLHRLTVNVVLGERRTRSRRPEYLQPVADLDEFFQHENASKQSGGGDLEKAITGLPVEARKIFVLHDIEGYRHKEISELTGRSVGTCKSQLHRARKLLREALER